MGCQCLLNENEVDVNYQRNGKIFTKSEEGIKLKAGPRRTKGPPLRSKGANFLGDISNYRREVLDCIDQHRRDHGASNLRMNSEINTIAQKFAEELAEMNELDYSENTFKGESLGESLYQSFKKLSAERLVNKWYDEYKDYNFNDNDPEPSHFSQMVWKSSTDFGLGVAVSRSGNYFYVANYYPTGNVSGYFSTNVGMKNGNTTFTVTKNTNGNTNTKKVTYSNFGNTDFNDFSKVGFNDFFNDFNNFNNKFNNDFNNNYNNNYGIENKNNYNDNKNKKNTKKTVIKTKYPDENENYANNKSDNYEPSPNVADVGGFSTFCNECLQAHNNYRKMHHSPPLTLNQELCDIAQGYAEKLAKANLMQHSENCYKGEQLGENIYMCGGMKATGKNVTDSWYSEVKAYNYNGDYQSGTGHFTQVVWKDTKQCGFGLATNSRGSTYVVGNYYPPGNYMGCFKANVLRP